MKLFISGISGLLGSSMAQQLKSIYQLSGCYFNHPVSLEGVQTEKIDLSCYNDVELAFAQVRPDVVIHTAALTNVEACEANPNLAYELNVTASLNVAKASELVGAKLVHISSDHLFDGESPWKKEEDTPFPLNVYARTKLESERVVLATSPDALVVRTNFFGRGNGYKTSFSDWIIKSLEQKSQLNMFSDSYITPILMDDLAYYLVKLIDQGATGVFNVVGRDRISKYCFARELAKVFNLPTENIRKVSISDFPFKARRPKDMSLSSEKIQDYLGFPTPTIAEGLIRLSSLGTR